MANLRSCGTILNMYAADFDGLVPPGLRGFGYMPSVFYKTTSGEDWRDFFEDSGYQEMFKVLICPACNDVTPIDDPANTAPQAVLSLL